MRKSTTMLMLGALMISAEAFAAPVSPEQAIQRMRGDRAFAKMKRMPSSASEIKLAKTFASSDNCPMLYIFNKGVNSGYMIAPADDRFPALLGFGDNGKFHIDSVAPAMVYFIETLAKEMEFTISSDDDSWLLNAEMAPEWEPIAPLIKTKWDQGEPYNKLCPTMELINTSTGELTGQVLTTATGCVATSMAQVMFYHKWPDVGVGSNKYDWNAGYSDVMKKTLSCDFSETKFDWNNMSVTYATNAFGLPSWTDKQANAVANLMYACGISVNMNYCSELISGSGAIARDQIFALVNNFKYSKGIRYKYRDFCTSREFEETIYNNLKEGLPVLYDGRGSAGGHSFVCDGYAGDHYFHFNWGWSGASDGYFYLARLSPSALGIGGGAGNFNSDQGISYNIRPVRDGVDTGVEEIPYINCVGNFDYYNQTQQNSTSGEKLTFTNFKVTSPLSGYNAGFWNMSTSKFTGYIGVVVVKPDGKMDFIPGVEAKDLESGRGVQTIPAYLELYPAGEYKIYPAIVDQENKRNEFIHVANGYRDHVNMTVLADGTRTFSNATLIEQIESAPELAVTCFNYSGKVYGNTAHNFLLSVANYSQDKDYYGDLTLVLKDSRGREMTTKPLGRYDVPAGQALPYTLSLTLDVLQKDYTVSFRDGYGRDLPGEYPLSIGPKGTALTTQLRVMSFTPTDILPKSAISKITFQVANYASTEVAAPRFSIFFAKEGETQGKSFTFSYPNATLAGGKAYTLAVNNLNANLEEGFYDAKVYWEAPTGTANQYNRILISNPIVMTVGYPVETVTMNKLEIEIGKGQTIKLPYTLTPANATFSALTWTSSKPEIAAVDNDGNINGLEIGEAYVSATAHNGSTDYCHVVVKASSGIEELSTDSSKIEGIYNLQGICLLKAPSAEQINLLDHGIYIFKTENGYFKISK